MQEPRESMSSKIVVPLVVVVLGALLVGGSAPWWWKIIFSDQNATSSPGLTVRPTTGPTTITSDDSLTPTPAPPTVAPNGGCVLTIANPFATISEKPSHDSTEIGDVPSGDYQPSDSRVVNWGGRDERWFEITASGRTGWIVYNSVIIESKSSECP